jgi:hypothetical protein
MLTRLLIPALLLTALAATLPPTAPSTAPNEKPLFEDTFETLNNWQPEGPFTPTLKDGRLLLKTTDKKPIIGQYLWCKKELPADYKIEFDVTPASDSGFFLIFFSQAGTNGEDILGDDLFKKYMPHETWAEYHDWDKYTSPPNRKHDSRIRGYHISYRRNESANCNLRKNPGLNLLKSSDIKTLLPKNKTAHVVLTKVGGHITLDVNGQRFMDHTDKDKPHTAAGTRFGFRQVYESEGAYDNVKVFDLTKSH